jgi:hypothetical protein
MKRRGRPPKAEHACAAVTDIEREARIVAFARAHPLACLGAVQHVQQIVLKGETDAWLANAVTRGASTSTVAAIAAVHLAARDALDDGDRAAIAEAERQLALLEEAARPHRDVYARIWAKVMAKLEAQKEETAA